MANYPPPIKDPGTLSIKQWNSDDWESDINRLCDKYGRSPARPRPGRGALSGKTKENRRDALLRCFGLLRKKVRGIVRLEQFTVRHARTMLECFDEAGVAKPTQIQYFSVLAWFWRLHGMNVKSIKDYAESPEDYITSTAAKVDHGVAQHVGDMPAFLATAREVDERIGWFCQLSYSAGLRKQECLCLDPHLNDRGEELVVNAGAKGGRSRTIDLTLTGPTTFMLAREAIDALKRITPMGSGAGWPGNGLKSNKSRFNYFCKKIGLTKNQIGSTFHGLRHDYANNGIEYLTGQLAPVRGGMVLDYRAHREHQKKISQQLGHNRAKITSAYYGSFQAMERRQQTNFVKYWEMLEPHLETVRTLMRDCGAAPELFLVGPRAMGLPVPPESAFNFLLAYGLADQVAANVSRALGSFLGQALGVPVGIDMNASSDPALREMLMACAFPLFSPPDTGKDSGDAGNAEPQVNRVMRRAGPRPVLANYRRSSYPPPAADAGAA